jgi:chromate reductase, NAD(P)H dehydrogenase (quinone)
MILICTASDGANLKLCRRAELFLKNQGVDTCFVDLTAAELPLYTSRVTNTPNGALISALGESFRRAEGFFIAAPEYNGSIPPTLSNTIAWLSTETEDFRALFNNKPAVIATHSGGGGQKVLTSMRIQLSHLGVNVLGRTLASKGDGEVKDTSLNDVLNQLTRLSQLK